jgi:hypothetical protein
MFEIQLTTFSEYLYNDLAHPLLYKSPPGLLTLQEEMTVDLSHGLSMCLELCKLMLKKKLGTRSGEPNRKENEDIIQVSPLINNLGAEGEAVTRAAVRDILAGPVMGIPLSDNSHTRVKVLEDMFKRLE